MNELKEYLKRELGISDEEYQRLVENKREEINSNPESPQAKISNLDARTANMQEIDFFTLDQTNRIEDRTIGLQDTDQFTLDLVFTLQTKIDELEQRIITLEGGNV